MKINALSTWVFVTFFPKKVTAHILVAKLVTLSDSLTEFFFSRPVGMRVFAFFPLRALREKGARPKK
jgi:hypothetical protein